jgi:hypothetical protein
MMPKEPALSLSKGAMTDAAVVSLYLNTAVTVIPHWLAHLPRALECFPLAVGTLARANIRLTLDNWLLEGDNRRGTLLFDGGVRATILLGACLCCQNPPFMLQTLEILTTRLTQK